MINITMGPPRTPKGEKGAKVVDIVRARQGDAPRKAYFERWAIDRDEWQMQLCQDGQVYIEVIGVGGVRAQLCLDAKSIEQLRSDCARVAHAQREYHKTLRGAHFWIARQHPTKTGWLMVKHNDHEVPFKPVTVGRRWKTDRDGNRVERATGACTACRKQFVVGEVAFDAQAHVHGQFAGRARICKGCTMPPNEAFSEVVGGKADE